MDPFPNIIVVPDCRGKRVDLFEHGGHERWILESSAELWRK